DQHLAQIGALEDVLNQTDLMHQRSGLAGVEATLRVLRDQECGVEPGKAARAESKPIVAFVQGARKRQLSRRRDRPNAPTVDICFDQWRFRLATQQASRDAYQVVGLKSKVIHDAQDCA